MKWVFNTYTTENTPSIFICEAVDIIEADTLYQAATGINPDKVKGVAVARFCPD